jgi:hypothetical protein
MPKSRNRKDHKKKTSQRKSKIEQEKVKLKNAQRDFFMKLIEEEKKKGLFDSNPIIEGPTMDGPILDGPEIIMD